MNEPDLFSQLAEQQRLSKLLARVRDCMSDGNYRTFAEIKVVTGGTETSISARLRELRSKGFVVEKRQRAVGLFEYRVERAKEQAA